MTEFIERNPRLWFEDIGEAEPGQAGANRTSS
jgi:hypothetical protein